MTTYNLAFQGGGMRGIAYVGALKTIDSYGITFSRYAGTSVGAIMAALCAVGYTTDELSDIVTAMSLPLLKDRKHTIWHDAAIEVTGLLEILNIVEIPQGGHEVAGGIMSGADVYHGLLNMGMHPGKLLKNIIELLLQYKIPGRLRQSITDGVKGIIKKFFRLDCKEFSAYINDQKPVTFDDIKQLSGKDLVIFATNLTTGQLEEFSKRSGQGSRSVSEATRMSAGYPFFFQPYPPDKLGDEDIDLYVDGGVLRNFPLYAFDEQGDVTIGLWLTDNIYEIRLADLEFQLDIAERNRQAAQEEAEQLAYDTEIEDLLLRIALLDNEIAESKQMEPRKKVSKWTYVPILLETMHTAIQELAFKAVPADGTFYPVPIDVSGVKTFQDISPEVRARLLKNGVLNTDEVLSTLRQEGLI